MEKPAPTISRRAALRYGLPVSAAAFALRPLMVSESGPSPHPMVQGAKVLQLLPPTEGNPRNTEGAFLTLRDGRILFAYTKFSGGTSDHAEATIVGRFSSDGGFTWTSDDITLVQREGQMNVMSVSLLRLQDGSICLFYLRKNSVHDCRPYVRRSTDDGKTWGDPVPCLDGEGYWVLNNDWVVMLRSGRLVFPVALHTRKGSDYNHRGIATVWFSDDSGGTWHPSETKLHCPTDSGAGFQEPGVVQLKEGRLLMFIRTRLGRQYYSYSKDEGTTWSPGEPSPLLSPLSPASIKRIPSTGDLLAVWNDHEGMPSEYRASERGARPFGGKRTPLTLAVSRDKGRTWQDRRNLLTDPAGWYCYTAIHFTGDNVLLGFASGGSGLPELSKMDVAVVPIASLYS